MKTQIGLLLPSSTIFPIAKDFEKGLKDGLGDQVNFTITKEFIGQGGITQTESAIDKLINFHDADIVTGIVSAKVTEFVAPKFLAAKKNFIVSELGEYITNTQKLNSNIFINSNYLWQHAWALGHWGVKEFGKKGMFIGSVYDAGYNFSNCFYEGMMAADSAADWSFSVPPPPPPKGLSDMSVIFPFLEKYQPDFIFAAFCGAEATLFLNELIRRGWHKKTKVTGLPFLLEPFEPLEDDINIYTTLPDPAMPEMGAAESFYYLGYRAGSNIKRVAENNFDGSIQQLGKAYCIYSTDATPDQVTIIQNNIKAGQTEFESGIVTTTSTLSFMDENLMQMTGEFSAGWLNPYLCI